MAANRIQSSPKSKSQRCGAGLILALAFLALGPSRLAAAVTKTLLFFGDSITAGNGLDPDDAYPALIQKKIDAAGLPWKVVNAGLSGETTAGGLRRLDWILRQRIDIFVIELGGNDGLRGIPPETSRANLQIMIERIREKSPQTRVVLAGMRLPTNLGAEYTGKFAAIYSRLAEANHVTLIPFLLAKVGGVPALNQADGIHPTAQGHQIITDTAWEILQPML